MLSAKERDWLEKNIDKHTTNACKTIILQSRLENKNGHKDIFQIGILYEQVDNDYRQFYQDKTFRNPQPEGKE